MRKHRRDGLPRDSRLRTLHCEQLEDRRLLAVVTVDTPLDVVDFTDGVTSLREAIFATNLVGGPDEIVFDFGDANPHTILLTQGELQITDSLTITGPGAALLTIDASGNDPTPGDEDPRTSRIFNIDDGDANSASDVQLTGLSLTGAYTYRDGGAIFSYETISISDCSVYGNRAGRGGGILSIGELTISHSIIMANGAFLIGGGICTSVIATITDCVVSNNSAREGGGVFAKDLLTIADSTVSDNQSGRGGGVFLGGVMSRSITNSIISGNSANYGGGVYAPAGTTSISDTTIANNSAQFSGGGIMGRGGSLAIGNSKVTDNTAGNGGGILARNITLSLVDSTISGNAARIGGGVYAVFGQKTIIGSTISGNTAETYGGGVWSLGDLSIAHSTIVNNTADGDGFNGGPGGGIFMIGAAAGLDHTIVAGNHDNSGGASDIAGVVNATYSLIGFGAQFLAPLADNGGPTQTHALLPGSPAINAGDPNFVGPPTSDQRGFPYVRVSGIRIDIGAFETQPMPGDFNEDLVVNAGDLAVWEADYGISQQMSGLDFLAWQTMCPLPAEAAAVAALSVADGESATLFAALEVTPPIIVTTHLDVVDFTDNLTSLREAIFAANTVPGAHTIEFDASLAGRTILLEHGELVIGDVLAILGLGASDLTVDGQELSRILYVNSPTGDFLFSGLTLMRGRNLDSGGGAIRCETSGQLAIEDCVITSNSTSAHGGGVFASGSVSVLSSIITDNYTGISGYGPGGFGGGIASAGSVEIHDSVVSGNRTNLYGGHGGGISAHVRVSLFNSEVSYNSTFGAGASGGGVFSGYVSLYDSIVTNNQTFGGSSIGGGISALHTLRAFNSSISNNSTNGNQAEGGGIWGRNMLMVNSTVSGNATFGTSASGGGIRTITPTIINSTISGNSTAGMNSVGGGMYVRSGVGDPNRLTLYNSTVTDNHSRLSSGGGIWTQPEALISNSIIAGNTARLTHYDIFADISPVTLLHSLIGDRANSELIEAPLGFPDANGNLIGGPVHGVIDPLLGPLADNGGPTQTHALLPGSPAINAGDPNFVGPPQFDQRGEPFKRVFGGRIDIGAFEAQSLVVDTVVDELDGDYSHGDFSLREATALANQIAGANTIEFAPSLAGQTILLEHGELRITDSLTITGLGADLLMIDAQSNSRILRVTDTAGDVSLNGLTFTGGSADMGGGILSDTAGTLSVEYCIITDNHALGRNLRTGFYGGGVWAQGDVVLLHSTVSHNTAYGSGGGIFSFGDVEVVDSLISHNEVVDRLVVGDPALQGGGGINAAGNVTVHRSRVEANEAIWSGGGITAAGDISLFDSTVATNRTDGAGGGIYVEGHLLVERSTISDNHADGTSIPSPIAGTGPFHDGGGVSSHGDVTVRDSTISGNTSTTYGGGIIVGSGEINITNGTISGNSAPRGGGIAAFSPHVVIAHTTIAENHADQGGGVYIWQSRPGLAFGTLEVSHSIVADNTASVAGVDILINPARLTMSHSLLGTRVSPDQAEAPLGSPDAHGNLIGGPVHGVIDPLLAPLADNGGPTLTHALLPGSPAINRGDLNAVAGVNGVPEFDQRGDGFPRIFGRRIDIGAFEYQAPSDLNLLVDTLVDESDGDHGRGDLALREAIELANLWNGHDTIEFDPALAGGTLLLNTGELSIEDELTIRGLGRDLLTIDAQQHSQIFRVEASAENVTMSGLTLAHGKGGLGGAISNQASLTLQGMNLIDNVGSLGGAIGTSGDLELEDTQLEGNRASNGGAILALNTTQSIVIRSSTFVNNFSSRGSSFEANLDDYSSVTIEDSTFDHDGIDIRAQDHSQFVLRSSTVFDVAGTGIRLFLEGDSSATIDSSTISNSGLGMSSASGSLLIDSSTISGNSIGGVFVVGDVLVSHSTITKNTGTKLPNAGKIAGGVDVRRGIVVLDHSIVAGNVDQQGQPSDIAGVVNAAYSLIGFGANFLGPLADNGGPTLTHALLPGSPAINAGDPNFTGPPVSDQRGFPYDRVSGGRIDIGAFETQPLPADFDDDLDVDHDDLAVWETDYSTPSGYSGLDFLTWQVMVQPPAPLPSLAPGLVDLALSVELNGTKSAALAQREATVEEDRSLDQALREPSTSFPRLSPWDFEPLWNELLQDDNVPHETDEESLAIAFDEVFAVI